MFFSSKPDTFPAALIKYMGLSHVLLDHRKKEKDGKDEKEITEEDLMEEQILKKWEKQREHFNALMHCGGRAEKYQKKLNFERRMSG